MEVFVLTQSCCDVLKFPNFYSPETCKGNLTCQSSQWSFWNIWQAVGLFFFLTVDLMV